MKKKLVISYTNVFCLLIFLYEFLLTLTHSKIVINYGSIIFNGYKIICMLIIVLSGYLIISKYSTFLKNRENIYFFIMLLSGIITYFTSQKDEILILSFILIGIKNIKQERVICALYKGLFIGVLFVIILSVLGFIDNGTYEALRGSQVVKRYTLGFSHPNTLAIILFQLTLMFLYLHKNTISKLQLLLILVVGIVCYKLTASRTIFICFLIMMLIIVIFRFFSVINLEQISKILFSNLIRILIIIGIFGSIYVAINYNSGSSFIQNIINIIGVRIQLLYDAMQLYKINFFGQNINLVNSQEYYLYKGTGVVLDNSYIYMLLEFGIVPTLLIFSKYFLSIKIIVQKKDYILLMSMILYLILGFTEKYFSGLSYNFTLIVLATQFGYLKGKGDEF